MKVTSVRLSSEVTYIDIGIKSPGTTDSYLIRSITGLDADDVVQRFYATAEDPISLQERGLYDMVMPNREIVMSIITNPDYGTSETYSDLRDALYKMIAASRFGDVTLSFFDGSTEKAILRGNISKLESVLFSEAPEIQLTIVAKDTMLRAPDSGRVYVSSGTLNASSTAFNLTDSDSTAPHGVTWAIQFDADVGSFTLGNNDEGWIFHLAYPGDGFKEDDILRFSSEHNRKYVFLNGYPGDPNDPPARPYSIIDLITPTSVWPIMFPGTNHFDYVATTYTWLNWSYLPVYWGI